MLQTSENDEQVQALGEYITTAIRGEINRTQGTATCLLTTLSFVGTVAAGGLAATSKGQGIWPILTLGVAAFLLLAALILILVALRPRLPKDPTKATGWPLVPHLTRLEYVCHAAEFGEFMREDAITLARIAHTKFRLIRRAYSLTIAGLPVLIVGFVLWF